jgi:hypothetical protein
VVFDDSARSQVSWTDDAGNRRTAALPGVSYVRAGRPAAARVALP